MELILTDNFINDLSFVETEKLMNHIIDTVYKLSYIPELGTNRNIPSSIRAQYGENIRRIPIKPFLIIYGYYEDRDTCVVYGLIKQRQAY